MLQHGSIAAALAITPLLHYSIIQWEKSSSLPPFWPPIFRVWPMKFIASNKSRARIGSIATSWTAISWTTFPSARRLSTRAQTNKAPAGCPSDDRTCRSLCAAFRRSRRELDHGSRRAGSKTRRRENFAANSRSGCRVGLTLNPATPFELLEPFLDKIDMLLVMTVHPGFGGQAFRADQMDKVRRAADWNKSRKRKIDIEVDGGINPETARFSVENGANVLVAGTSIFHAKDYAKAIRELRGE